MRKKQPVGTSLIELDPLLKPFALRLRERYEHYQTVKTQIENSGGILGKISQGYRYFGFNHGQKGDETGVWYREWAPGAQSLSLIGDFNDMHLYSTAVC